jgi:formamidopyrimidine-DNA glycosylase
VTAGVGNWIADEVIYQAGLDPEMKTRLLSREDVERLLEKLLLVVETAVKSNHTNDELPKEWLVHYRWEKRLSAKEVQRDFHGNEIIFKTVAGRTTAIVPTSFRWKPGHGRGFCTSARPFSRITQSLMPQRLMSIAIRSLLKI